MLKRLMGQYVVTIMEVFKFKSLKTSLKIKSCIVNLQSGILSCDRSTSLFEMRVENVIRYPITHVQVYLIKRF